MKKKYIKRPPRIFKNDKGRFIIRRGKKVYINSPTQSNKQIVNIVLNNVRNRRRVKRPPKKDIISSKINQYTKLATDVVSDGKISASESSNVLKHQLELQQIKRMLEVEKEKNTGLIKQATDEGKQKLIKQNAQAQQQIQQIEDVIEIPNAPQKTIEAKAKQLFKIQNDIYKLEAKPKKTQVNIDKLIKLKQDREDIRDDVATKFNDNDFKKIFDTLSDLENNPPHQGRIKEQKEKPVEDTTTLGKIKDIFKSPKKGPKPKDEEEEDDNNEEDDNDEEEDDEMETSNKGEKTDYKIKRIRIKKTAPKGPTITSGPDNSLYDSEINKIMDFFDAKDYGFKGVYSSDELNEIKISPSEKRISFIMNTSPKSVSTGHWVAIYIDKEEGTLEYFDSLAQEPSDDFKVRIKKLIDKMNPTEYFVFKINKIKYQANSSSCGYHAIMFLISRYSNKSFKDVSGYSMVREAERNVEKFKDKLKQKFGYI